VPGGRKNGLQIQNEERKPRLNGPKRLKIFPKRKYKTGMRSFSAACLAAAIFALCNT
jgi:hypothetical protein